MTMNLFKTDVDTGVDNVDYVVDNDKDTDESNVDNGSDNDNDQVDDNDEHFERRLLVTLIICGRKWLTVSPHIAYYHIPLIWGICCLTNDNEDGTNNVEDAVGNDSTTWYGRGSTSWPLQVTRNSCSLRPPSSPTLLQNSSLQGDSVVAGSDSDSGLTVLTAAWMS